MRGVSAALKSITASVVFTTHPQQVAGVVKRFSVLIGEVKPDKDEDVQAHPDGLQKTKCSLKRISFRKDANCPYAQNQCVKLR